MFLSLMLLINGENFPLFRQVLHMFDDSPTLLVQQFLENIYPFLSSSLGSDIYIIIRLLDIV